MILEKTKAEPKLTCKKKLIDKSEKLIHNFIHLNRKGLLQCLKMMQHTSFLHSYPEKIPYILKLTPEEKNIFMEDAIKQKNPHEILSRDSFEDNRSVSSAYNPDLDDLLKDKLAGPWNIDTRSHKLIKDLGENIHFDTLLRCLALDNLSCQYKQRIILFTPVSDAGGYANYRGDVVVSNTETESFMREALAHEFSHRGMMLSNQYLSANPYSNNDNIANEKFDSVMKKTLSNLHQYFMPNKDLPSSPVELAQNLENYKIKNRILEQERGIINVFTQQLFFSRNYAESQYHSEFVVRLPELIAQIGEFPPYIRDAFSPLEIYYKTDITPKWLEYINIHSHKDMLLAGDMEKYYPETILNFSGEDELLRKDSKNLKNEEQELVSQIQKMKHFIETDKIDDAHVYLIKCN